MFLVVGVGRCGSSAIAASLERLGVDMGGPGKVQDATPEGDYEDRTFRALNWALSKREITRDEYVDRLKAYAATREEPWGLKHPLTSEFPTLVAEGLPDDMVVIWAQRDLDATVESWKRWFPGPDDFCEIWVPFRHYTLKAWLWRKPHIRIDMTERVPEAAIDRALGEALERYASGQWDSGSTTA